MTPLDRRWPFISFLDAGFAEIFSQIVSMRVKKLSNTNFISSRHNEREKASLPVDIHHSKTLLLKLPIIRRRALIKFSFQRSVTLLICLWKKYLVIEDATVPFEYFTHRCISMHVYKILTISPSLRSSLSMISRPLHSSYPHYIREWGGREGGTYSRGALVW